MVTDLTNTTWYFKSEIDISSFPVSFPSVIYLNFRINGTLFTILRQNTGPDNAILEYVRGPIVTTAYNGGWSDQTYRLMTITGGDDAANTDLIAWVNANATQLPVTDLTGTTWTFKDTGIVSYGSGSTTPIYLTTTYDGGSAILIRSPYTSGGNILATLIFQIEEGTSRMFLKTTDLLYTSQQLTDGEGWYTNVDFDYSKISPPTITITGGDDVTNTDLIAWVNANAEQIIEPTGNEYTLTQNLTNLTSGNVTLTITADEGYSLPAQADIVVTGGTIVSYDDETGVLVVTAGTTAVEVTCESATPSGYTEMTLSNGDTFTTSNGEEFLVKESEE